jgi:hypothetical protein
MQIVYFKYFFIIQYFVRYFKNMGNYLQFKQYFRQYGGLIGNLNDLYKQYKSA